MIHHSNRGREMSLASYNALIGAILCYGFFVNYLMVKFCTGYFIAMSPFILVIGYLIIAIIGITMSARSNNAFLSFIGYNLVVVPSGAILCVFLKGVAPEIVKSTLLITALVTASMMIASMIFPKIFLSLGGTLGLSLGIVLIIEFVCIMLGIVTPRFWDIAVALLFCLYIGYDWAKAQDEYRNADNAVDACVGLYLDIINLFTRVNSSSRKRK